MTPEKAHTGFELGLPARRREQTAGLMGAAAITRIGERFGRRALEFGPIGRRSPETSVVEVPAARL
jgi:hypothetical protein